MKLIRQYRIITLFAVVALCIVSSGCTEIKAETHSAAQSKVQIQTKTQEKINLKDGIFMDSKMLKHKKSKFNLEKNLKTYVSIPDPETKKGQTQAPEAGISSAAPGQGLTDNATKNAQISLSLQNANKPTPKEGDCAGGNGVSVGLSGLQSIVATANGKASIVVSGSASGVPSDLNSALLFEGWVKYFKFPERVNKLLPKKFFKNGEYYEQMKYFPKVNYTQINNFGDYDFVKSDDFFYLMTFKSIITFYSSKQVILFIYFFIVKKISRKN